MFTKVYYDLQKDGTFSEANKQIQFKIVCK